MMFFLAALHWKQSQQSMDPKMSRIGSKSASTIFLFTLFATKQMSRKRRFQVQELDTGLNGIARSDE
jgi:hypothetical protein